MHTRKTLFTIAALFAVSAPVRAESPKADPVNHTRKGVGIQGYDPVAYFTDSKPVKGDLKYSYSWRGATWLFASAEHRDSFAQFPDKYAPEYGGYCAYGVSENHTVDIDPEAWRIIGGKLYLNYSKSVQQQFLKDPEGRIRKANQNWPALHN
jgi:YHS domain-containing protein